MIYRPWDKENETREQYTARLDKTIARMDAKTPQDHDRIMHQHRHNGHLGNIKRAYASVQQVKNYPESLTFDAKTKVDQIMQLLHELEQEVYMRRVNLDGTIQEIKHAAD